MIVTNIDTIVARMKTLFILLVLNCLFTCSGIILKSLIKTELRWPLFCLSILITFIILKAMFNIRVLQFENIGATFSIKSYHPLKKGIIFPVLEFPVASVQSLTRENSLMSDSILITVMNHNNKKNRFKIKVTHLSDTDFKKIRGSLKLNLL